VNNEIIFTIKKERITQKSGELGLTSVLDKFAKAANAAKACSHRREPVVKSNQI
jgi:hypothetical protein